MVKNSFDGDGNRMRCLASFIQGLKVHHEDTYLEGTMISSMVQER